VEDHSILNNHTNLPKVNQEEDTTHPLHNKDTDINNNSPTAVHNINNNSPCTYNSNDLVEEEQVQPAVSLGKDPLIPVLPWRFEEWRLICSLAACCACCALEECLF
jgi:hypothetical protein